MAFAKLGNHWRAWELMRLINPLNHGKSARKIATYKVEPYVVAADVYARAPHVGRGGWTWYTGSAGWMYRLIVESLLGLKLEGDKLHVTPCLPYDWHTYRMNYRYRDTMYRIVVTQTAAGGAGAQVTVDGVMQMDAVIALQDDKREHAVEIVLSAQPDAKKN
jgi:cellobiose phosphorylase